MDPFANNHHHQSFHVMEAMLHNNQLPIQQYPPPPPPPPPVNGEKKRGGAEKRGGVKLSTDPQSVAARQRRHRISDRFKMLKSLVPGGSKMDTVSMLEEAINYVKFLKAQIWLHQTALLQHHPPPPPPPPPPIVPSLSFDEHEYERLVRVSQLVVSAPSSYRTLPIGGGGGGSGASGCSLLASDDVDEQMVLMEAEHEPRLSEEADLDCLPPFP